MAKVSELSRVALDWAVCEAGGGGKGIRNWIGGYYDYHMYRYSTMWSHGGPIIDREEISIKFDRDRVFNPGEIVERWHATLPMICDAVYDEYGPTPLIAAMRCYVSSKLGEEIEIPKELL